MKVVKHGSHEHGRRPHAAQRDHAPHHHHDEGTSHDRAVDPGQPQRQSAAAGTVWTCPMHPEIRRNEPGACPICGMALEPLAPSAEEGENAELEDMTRRFWISVALSIPLL